MIEPIGPSENTNIFEQYRNLYGNYDLKAGSGMMYGAVSPRGPGTAANQPVQRTDQAQGSSAGAKLRGERECQTCANRKYQDGSDDPGVSYQTPTKISADQAASAVRAHENEHVVREQAKARREGREVISQSVILKTAICPDCGSVYVSGGETRTVTQNKDQQESFSFGTNQGKEPGRLLDAKV